MYPNPNQPPGWYPDPSGSPALRWWDGTRWTPFEVWPQTAAGAPPAPQPSVPTETVHPNRRLAAMMIGVGIVLVVLFCIWAGGLVSDRPVRLRADRPSPTVVLSTPRPAGNGR